MSGRGSSRTSGRMRARGITANAAWSLAALVVTTVVALSLAWFRGSMASTAVTALLGVPTWWVAWTALFADPAPREVDLDEVAGELADAVRSQWEAELAVRQDIDPSPLPVAWAAADPGLAEPWSVLTARAAGRPRGAPGDSTLWAGDARGLAGEGPDILTVFTEKLPTRRLVVLGGPGTGKSALLVRLLQALVVTPGAGVPVPVLFSLASWDVEHSLKDWLADQLRRTYIGLRRPVRAQVAVEGGGVPDLARALLDTGRILPLLDGLDELPPERHALALRALNTTLPAWQPLVVASRTDAYRAALNRPDAAVRLDAAAAVELLPVRRETAAAYLCQGSGSSQWSPDRWNAVIARLGDGDSPVGQALSTPLGLFLARSIYQPPPRSASLAPAGPARVPHPDELCDESVFGDRTAIDAHLFEAYIPAAYAPHVADQRHPARWSPERAHRTFSFLARYLEEHRGGAPDLAWWELPRAMRAGPRLATAVLVAALDTAVTFAIGRDLAVGVAVGNTLGIALGAVFGRRLSSASPRAQLRWSRIGVALGAVIGACFGLAGWIAGGIAGGILGGHREGSPTRRRLRAVSPRGIAGGVAGGLAGGVAGHVFETAAAGVAMGLAVGIAFGISFGHRVGTATPSARLNWSLDDVAGGFAAGLAGGAAVGFVGGFGQGVVEKSVYACIGGLAGAIAFGIDTRPPDLSVSGPYEQFTLDRRAFWAFGGAFGLAVGLAGGLVLGVVGGIVAGIMGGFAGGLSRTAWAYFVIARAYLSWRRHVPRNLMAFLRDAHEHRGVLRQEGTVYQFRHIDLQRHLAGGEAEAAGPRRGSP